MKPLKEESKENYVEKIHRFLVTEFVKTCDELVIGWYPGKLPPYQVKFTAAPEAVVNVKTPVTTATKGQLNSECPFGVFKSPKKPTKVFQDFCPSL